MVQALPHGERSGLAHVIDDGLAVGVTGELVERRYSGSVLSGARQLVSRSTFQRTQEFQQRRIDLVGVPLGDAVAAAGQDVCRSDVRVKRGQGGDQLVHPREPVDQVTVT